MQQFTQLAEQLVSKSDQWITKKAIADKVVFESTVQSALNELPPVIKQHLSSSANGNEFTNFLWDKIQIKYGDSSKDIATTHYFCEADIDEEQQRPCESALQSEKATLQHYHLAHSTLNPFFKPYDTMSCQQLHDLLDIMSPSECSNEWISLIQQRIRALLRSLNVSKNETKKIRALYQKYYRAFCAHLGNECERSDIAFHDALLLNQILLICKRDDKFCTDGAMNLLSFVRVLFDYAQEHKTAFEAIQKRVNLRALIVKLFDAILKEYTALRSSWTNTQRLFCLYTLYEAHRDQYIAEKQLLPKLEWLEDRWSYNELKTVFLADTGLESFADFTNAIYKHNRLSTLYSREHVDADDAAQKGQANEDEFDDDEMDMMGMDADAVIVDNINDIEDGDLFTVDDFNEEAVEQESNEADIDYEPPTKKQKTDDTN